MTSPFERRLKRRIGRYVPAFCACLLLLLAVAPFRWGALNDVFAGALIASIYYWGLFRPAQMPYWLVFALGLLFDVLTGLPPGLSSFMWLCLRGMVNVYGRMFATAAFPGVWVGFAVIFALCTLAGWVLLSWYYSRWLPALGPARFWLTASFAYPLPHLLFTGLYKSFEPEARRGLGRW